MPLMRTPRTFAFILLAFAFQLLFSALCCPRTGCIVDGRAVRLFRDSQSDRTHCNLLRAYLRRDPDKAAPLRTGRDGRGHLPLQRCDHYDWLAIPLIPYLYSVEDIPVVPDRVDRATVNRLRNEYYEAHLPGLGEQVRRAASGTAAGRSLLAYLTNVGFMRFGLILRKPRMTH